MQARMLRQGGSDVQVRMLRREDLPAIYTWLRHPVVVRQTLQVPSLQQGWMTRWFQDPQNTIGLVAEVTGEAGAGESRPAQVVGMVSLHRFSGRQEHVAGLGIAVDPRYHGQGVGTRLMAAALDLADRYWRLVRVELDVYPDNEAALRLYRRFGFQEEGRRIQHAIREGTYVDTVVMSRIRWQDPAPGSASDTQADPAASLRAGPLQARPAGPTALEVRPPVPGDAAGLVRLYSDPELVRDSLLLPFPPPDEKKIAGELESFPAAPVHVFLALWNGKVCGEVRLVPWRSRLSRGAEITLLVPPPGSPLALALGFPPQEVAQGLLGAALDLADRWLLLHRLQLGTYADEAWLFPVLHELGFRQEARQRLAALRDGVFADRLVWGRVAAGGATP